MKVTKSGDIDGKGAIALKPAELSTTADGEEAL